MKCDKCKAPVKYSEISSGMIPAKYDDTELVELREKVEAYEKLVEEVKKCLPWMVTDMTHRADQVNVGCYSDELKQAIATKGLLDLLG